jgi:hypothetical protein
MRDAGRWVRQTVAASRMKPMAPEVMWERLESYAGRGPLAVGRSKNVLEYIERQLTDRQGGAAMRALWQTANAYLEHAQRNLAA